MSNKAGNLYVVATPIGNLDDISARAIAVLRAVSLIAAEDTRHSRRLLDYYGIQTRLTSLHEHNELQAGSRLLAHLQAGKDAALISDAGTPLISDPGFPLVRACREAGVRVVPVPGPSALIAALSVSGLPTDRFCFEGFLPRNGSARRQRLEGLKDNSATLVFYESSHRILEALEDMAAVFGGDRLAVIGRELTKVHEELLSAPLAELRDLVAIDENRRKGEFVVMVAGRTREDDELSPEIRNMLATLVEELPLKQAAAIAARLSGVKKNRLYQLALEMKGPGNGE